MVQKCCITSCRSQRFGNPGLKLHKFPRQKNLSDKWAALVSIVNKNFNFSPTIHTRICSRHFRAFDYITIFDIQRLKSDALPSIFHSRRSFLHEFEGTVKNISVSSTSIQKVNLLLDQNLEFEETVINDYLALTSNEKINFLEDDELLKQILEFEESVKNDNASTQNINLLENEMSDQNLETKYIPRIATSKRNDILYQATAVPIATIELEHNYCKPTKPITSVGNKLLDQPTVYSLQPTVLLEPEKLPAIYIGEALSTKKDFESMPTKNSTPLRKRKLMRFCGDFKK